MKESASKTLKSKQQVKKSPKVRFTVKLSPKKKEKEVFNPFGLDLSTNVQKILGLDSQKNKGYQPGRKYANVTSSRRIYRNQEVLGYLEQEANEKKVQHKFKNTQFMKRIVIDTQEHVQFKKKYTARRIFKKQPLRRHETDMLIFKEVFVAPRQQKLKKLSMKKQGIHQENANEEIHPQFKQLIKEVKNPNEIKIKKKRTSKLLEQDTKEVKNLLRSTAQLQTKPQYIDPKKVKTEEEASLKYQKDYTIQEKIDGKDDRQKGEKNFFESQILVQPTEMPNATIASPLTPGNGWAPSLPLLNLKNTNKESVKDLLIRANAGMQAGDIQKEAHLTFYLGVIHEANRNYKQAIKFHKKFYSCAKLMEDKVGMALAMNRIGINLFNSGAKKRSIEYHQKNIEFTDQENAFAGLYNLGISYRSIKNYRKAIEFFEKALKWAKERKEVESECLSYGQLGMTCLKQKNMEKSLDYFQKCLDLARYMRNTRLELDCLMHMSKITNQTVNDPRQSLKVLKDTFETAKQLGDMKTVSVCVCNIGIIEGELGLDNYINAAKKQLEERKNRKRYR